jgi:hypothetical protein
MKVDMQHDGDPRYGWASVDLEGATVGMIVVHTGKGSFGFNFSERDLTMHPICTCAAWGRAECACPHLPPDYWKG